MGIVEGLHVNVHDTGNQSTFQAISFDDVNIGTWVIAIYEDEKWLADVVYTRGNQVLVRCLEKPFGVKEPQNLEWEEDTIFIEQVFHTDVPTLSQIASNRKKGCKWFWHYWQSISAGHLVIFFMYSYFSIRSLLHLNLQVLMFFPSTWLQI